MAVHNVVRSIHGTLDTTDPDEVNFLQAWDRIEIINRSLDEELFVTYDSTTPPADDEDSTLIRPGEATILTSSLLSGIQTEDSKTVFHQIYLVGTSNEYSVEGLARF